MNGTVNRAVGVVVAYRTGMLAVTGSKHGSTYIYDLLRICVPFFLFRANFGLDLG